MKGNGNGLEKRLLILYAQTFLHPGAGSTTGVVDLPIQREVNTNFPYIAGSGLKGSLRDKAEALARYGAAAPGQDDAGKTAGRAKVATVFGPEAKASDDYASCIAVGDAKILAMPVRSLTRTFFWVTSPLALARLRRDLVAIGEEPSWQIPSVPDGPTALVPTACFVSGAGGQDGQPGRGGQLMLEELNFNVKPDEVVGQIARDIASLLPPNVGQVFVDKFACDFALLSDEDFTHLVRFGTQVSARIALNERKTTSGDGGNLWYEEYLPPETVFYSLLYMNTPRNAGEKDSPFATAADAMRYLTEDVLGDGYLQVGGNETQGQGWCLVRVR